MFMVCHFLTHHLDPVISGTALNLSHPCWYCSRAHREQLLLRSVPGHPVPPLAPHLAARPAPVPAPFSTAEAMKHCCWQSELFLYPLAAQHIHHTIAAPIQALASCLLSHRPVPRCLGTGRARADERMGWMSLRTRRSCCDLRWHRAYLCQQQSKFHLCPRLGTLSFPRSMQHLGHLVDSVRILSCQLEKNEKLAYFCLIDLVMQVTRRSGLTICHISSAIDSIL